MALPAVASLCRALGEHLHPADGFVVPEIPVTAVHVSELVDPTSYVSGGELLLTTGLILPTSRIGWDGYVSRLKSIGIAALGIGPGRLLLRTARSAGRCVQDLWAHPAHCAGSNTSQPAAAARMAARARCVAGGETTGRPVSHTPGRNNMAIRGRRPRPHQPRRWAPPPWTAWCAL